MSESTVEFLSFQTNTLTQIYRERVMDWIESGEFLLRKIRLHKKAYRKKICETCSEEQQKKRKCVKNTLINGTKIKSCTHLKSAIGRKFKKEFDNHMNFHPALNRIKIIKESEKIELELSKFEPIMINSFVSINPNI